MCIEARRILLYATAALVIILAPSQKLLALANDNHLGEALRDIVGPLRDKWRNSPNYSSSVSSSSFRTRCSGFLACDYSLPTLEMDNVMLQDGALYLHEYNLDTARTVRQMNNYHASQEGHLPSLQAQVDPRGSINWVAGPKIVTNAKNGKTSVEYCDNSKHAHSIDHAFFHFPWETFNNFHALNDNIFAVLSSIILEYYNEPRRDALSINGTAESTNEMARYTLYLFRNQRKRPNASLYDLFHIIFGSKYVQPAKNVLSMRKGTAMVPNRHCIRHMTWGTSMKIFYRESLGDLRRVTYQVLKHILHAYREKRLKAHDYSQNHYNDNMSSSSYHPVFMVPLPTTSTISSSSSSSSFSESASPIIHQPQPQQRQSHTSATSTSISQRQPRVVLSTRNDTGKADSPYRKLSVLTEAALQHAFGARGFATEICCDFKTHVNSVAKIMDHFLDVDVCIGIHGAGLTNCVFGGEGMILIEFVTEHGYGTNLFQQIGLMAGGHFISVDIRDSQKIRGSPVFSGHVVPQATIDHLANIVASMHQHYASSPFSYSSSSSYSSYSSSTTLAPSSTAGTSSSSIPKHSLEQQQHQHLHQQLGASEFVRGYTLGRMHTEMQVAAKQHYPARQQKQQQQQQGGGGGGLGGREKGSLEKGASTAAQLHNTPLAVAAALSTRKTGDSSRSSTVTSAAGSVAAAVSSTEKRPGPLLLQQHHKRQQRPERMPRDSATLEKLKRARQQNRKHQKLLKQKRAQQQQPNRARRELAWSNFFKSDSNNGADGDKAPAVKSRDSAGAGIKEPPSSFYHQQQKQQKHKLQRQRQEESQLEEEEHGGYPRYAGLVVVDTQASILYVRENSWAWAVHQHQNSGGVLCDANGPSSGASVSTLHTSTKSNMNPPLDVISYSPLGVYGRQGGGFTLASLDKQIERSEALPRDKFENMLRAYQAKERKYLQQLAVLKDEEKRRMPLEQSMKALRATLRQHCRSNSAASAFDSSTSSNTDGGDGIYSASTTHALSYISELSASQLTSASTSSGVGIGMNKKANRLGGMRGGGGDSKKRKRKKQQQQLVRQERARRYLIPAEVESTTTTGATSAAAAASKNGMDIAANSSRSSGSINNSNSSMDSTQEMKMKTALQQLQRQRRQCQLIRQATKNASALLTQQKLVFDHMHPHLKSLQEPERPDADRMKDFPSRLKQEGMIVVYIGNSLKTGGGMPVAPIPTSTSALSVTSTSASKSAKEVVGSTASAVTDASTTSSSSIECEGKTEAPPRWRNSRSRFFLLGPPMEDRYAYCISTPFYQFKEISLNYKQSSSPPPPCDEPEKHRPVLGKHVVSSFV